MKNAKTNVSFANPVYADQEDSYESINIDEPNERVSYSSMEATVVLELQ